MMIQLVPDGSLRIQPRLILAAAVAELDPVAELDQQFEQRLVRVDSASKTFRCSDGMTASIPPGHQRTERRS
jgi:hypothetical protein